MALGERVGVNAFLLVDAAKARGAVERPRAAAARGVAEVLGDELLFRVAEREGVPVRRGGGAAVGGGAEAEAALALVIERVFRKI